MCEKLTNHTLRELLTGCEGDMSVCVCVCMHVYVCVTWDIRDGSDHKCC